MFGLGIWEIALILIVALLVLGPERLPKVARQLGKGLREVRKTVGDFQSQLAQADIEEERRAVQSAVKEATSNTEPKSDSES